MIQIFRQLDRLLRGEFTKAEELETGEVKLPTRWLVGASLLCGILYGLCMGLYAASGDTLRGSLQFVSSALKVPSLFLLTLVVTFPSLYVFGALAGIRLGAAQMLRLLVAAITVNLAVVASFGPVTLFFTVFTTSHAFISLLNVVFFALSGFVSLGFLARAARAVLEAEGMDGATSQRRARLIFRTWIVIYGIVGAQMGWILRPFVGNPKLEFVWFRHHRETNFFTAFADMIRDVTGSW